MLPSMGPESRKHVKTKPHFVIKIKEGWRFEEKGNLFVHGEQRIDVKADLPPTSRVAYLTPQLAGARRNNLDANEAELLRYFNIILPAGSAPSDYIKIARNWPCVEMANLPPKVGLADQTE